MAGLPLIPISPRERDVLRALAADHATNAEVAARLFISIRTVESHVASLLRKTGAHDRRALLRMAPDLLGAPASVQPFRVPLTPLIGRAHDRALVVSALAAGRLVTVVGPGGSGKTRLALDVLGDFADPDADPPVEVDLVPVPDASRVPSLIAERLGLVERGSAEAVLAEHFRTRRGLVLLDNCEHLTGLAALLERLLSRCAGLSVLATSRTRFAVPFETVVRLDGLPPDAAVELFARRAASAGAAIEGDDLRLVGTICRRLDGMPLALELAAAQVPAIGLDGVESALADPLALLAGAGGAVPRHGSLRATLQWSHDLLGPVERAVLRRLAVLGVPFPVEVAEAVAADWAPVPAGAVRLLAPLVDASLLGTERGAGGTRYRMHEVVRRFAAELAEGADEAGVAESRLLAWCGDRVAQLEAGGGADPLRSDADASLVRSAVEGAAARRTGADPLLAGLARRLAAVRRSSGAPAEAQRMFELAATLAPTATATAGDLVAAAAAAETRGAGDAAVALHRDAAGAWETAGAPARAADQLARAAELLNRAPGFFAEPPGADAAEALIAAARRLAGNDLQAAARILTAASFAAPPDAGAAAAQEAGELARRAGDLASESAALDAESSVELVSGALARAYTIQLRRIALLERARTDPAIESEYEDALQTASGCALAVGDLPNARRFAGEIERLPSLAGERHLAVGTRMVVDALRGDLAAVVDCAPGFLASWDRAGRPALGVLSSSALAAATAFALLGDDAAAAQWRSVADELFGHRTRSIDFEPATFDLLVLLHRGQWAAALGRAWSDPAAEGPILVAKWVAAQWRPWYTALRVEAAVLGGAPDAAARLAAAPQHLGGNTVAEALIDRAAALLAADSAALAEVAHRLDALDAPYQAARTRLLAEHGPIRGDTATREGSADRRSGGAGIPG